ncbi:MAG: hypothetical protein HND55_00765 [Pseudomonadota bacterium]|nr:MAG: hypothetical protein HND55_00765 [Pseudomonadota bacterium]
MKIHKVDAARRQIEAAIRLWEDEDHVSALTLAGAAEEILGNLLGRSNMTSFLKRISDQAEQRQSKLPPKELYKIVNRTKNALKHANDDSEDAVEFDVEDARLMVTRALINYQELTGALTSKMSAFMAKHVIGSWLLPEDE